MAGVSRKRRWWIYAAAASTLAVLILVSAMVVLIARFEPADLARLVSDKVKERTGRSLAIDGSASYSLSIFPQLTLERVRFQNAPWGSRPDMIAAKEVRVQIAVLPLLAGTIEVRGLVLVEPDVLLEVDRHGKGNWQFETPASTASTDADSRPSVPKIKYARIEHGVAAYRDKVSGRETQLSLERLELDHDGAELDIRGKGTVNAIPLEVTATLPAGNRKTPSSVTVNGPGLRLQAHGSAAWSAQAATTELAFSAEVDDWTTASKLLQTDLQTLPALKAGGTLRLGSEVVAFEHLDATLGRSHASGYVRLTGAATDRAIDVRIDAALIDLPQLLGPDSGKSRSDSKIFSADPFPLEVVSGLNGKAEMRIGRLALRDGKSVDNVRLAASFDRGRMTLGTAQADIEGKPLEMRALADASSGKTLKLDMTIEGRGVPLGALGALLDITGTPEGSPTDLDVRVAASGNSMRSLAASATGDVRIVAGPGRVRNRVLHFAADVTELIKLLNPAYAEPYTELECAVIRLPLRQGVARVANSIAVETSKVDVIAAGTIDLRNETLDLGFRTRAATGLGIGLGTLAELGRLRGTFADPDVEVDVGATAKTAAHIGLAAITGGLSLIASGLLAERVPDNACQVALGTAKSTGASAAEPGVVDSVLGNIKKIFGR